jgi:thioredoxin 1
MYAKFVLCALLLSAAALAHALEIKPYSAQALAAAQKSGQPVAIQFHADWCPTCKAQDKVLQSLKAEPGLDVTLLVANYDTEKALKQRFKVRAQSTIVVLHGTQECARLVGDTSRDAIRDALKKAL